MIAINIGKTFLEAYNQKFDTDYSARSFFNEIFFPLFYDHPKYMQWIHNSPFFQLSGAKKESPIERNNALTKLQNRIKDNEIDASTAFGFPSLEDISDASGQITNLIIQHSEEDIYASWIGGGLGIGVKGGYAIFFNNKALLLKIFEGWQYYRTYLEEIPDLPPNKIDAWNGRWISHILDPHAFIESEPLANFNPFETNKKNKIEIPPQKWVKVLAGIANLFLGKTVTGYIFSLGQ